MSGSNVLVMQVGSLRQWRPPREESELRPLIEVSTARVQAAEEDAERKARVHAELDAALASVRGAWARGREWRPDWWPSPLASYAGDRAARLLEEAIHACETGAGRSPVGRAGVEVGYFEDTCWQVLRAAAGGEPAPHDAEARLQQRCDDLAALADELEQRQRGPGEPRPYRLLVGSLSRWEGDKATGRRQVYRSGAAILLDDWQARAAPLR